MPHTLLLADDSVTIQRVIELTFADEDVRVIAVGDGRHAIDRIGHEPPDIVLADIGMPGSDGYEVAAFVKSRPDLAHIPVLLLTGAFEPVDENRVREVGADGVLAKPFEPQELITRVKALLGGTRPTAASSPADAGVTGPAGAAQETAGAHGSLPADERGAPLPPPSPRGGVSLDDYFDRLDAAFASLSVPSHLDEAISVPAPSGELQWQPHESGAASPATPGAGRATPAGSPPQVGTVAPATAVTPATAFAAILDAELSGRSLPDAARRADDYVLPPTYPPVEELVDRVARRVIDLLADQSLRDTVADAVSTTAERLVREEIERLKATMQ